MVGAEETVSCNLCDSNTTKLRLYFGPDTMSARNPNGFEPEIAKLYVDDLYVGDAIVNLHDFVPSFRFPKSTVKIRIEMSEARKFETTMTFLGHGSTQVLCVNFGGKKPLAEPASVSTTPDAAAKQPFDN